jgi:hypothetical protein
LAFWGAINPRALLTEAAPVRFGPNVKLIPEWHFDRNHCARRPLRQKND